MTVRRLHLRDGIRDRNSLGPQRGQDRRVVHQVAENRQRPGVGVLECQGDRVTDAKAHAQMAGANDVQKFHLSPMTLIRGPDPC